MQMTVLCYIRYRIIAVLLLLLPMQELMAEEKILIIEDPGSSSDTVNAVQWRLVTDNVMGGISQGRLIADSVSDRQCLRMQGDVKLENNGGFVQMALNLTEDKLDDIASYTGLVLEAYGNGESYNIHLRTSNLWLPWQSYRFSFIAPAVWKTFYVPFTDFTPYRTSKKLKLEKIERIGVVAIGREFTADLCIGKIGLYR